MARKFKPLTLGSLPRVMINVQSLEDEGVVVFANAMNGCEEMKTWFELTKLVSHSEELPPLPTHAMTGDSSDTVEVRTRRALSEFFRAILALSKVTRSMFVKDFDRLLNELGRQDFWGTEGQCDPRGDRRG